MTDILNIQILRHWRYLKNVWFKVTVAFFPCRTSAIADEIAKIFYSMFHIKVLHSSLISNEILKVYVASPVRSFIYFLNIWSQVLLLHLFEIARIPPRPDQALWSK